MSLWDKLLSNEVLISALVGWTVAQFLKTIFDFALNRSFSAERLVGSGGMPSSHSSTVCALTTSAAVCYGIESFEFAICFVLAAVVMYDAIGVRQETGKQAKLLNLIMDQDFFRFYGLFRSVSLVCIPKAHVWDIRFKRCWTMRIPTQPWCWIRRSCWVRERKAQPCARR